MKNKNKKNLHSITRREFLNTSALIAGGLVFNSTNLIHAQASKNIKIGAIFDLTGGLNIYGIQQSRALNLAVETINESGGVLGKKIEVVEQDAQSELSKYTQYANTLIRRDRISALFAGLTSSSREAIRPIIRKRKIPYFYSALYEGGACDKYTFVTGATASQQMSVLIEWGIERYGPKIYIMAPDYNFGTISGLWVKRYAEEHGGRVVGEDYLPLTATDYSSTIQKIQSSRPDFVVALPVGANQTGFLEQFAAAGLKERIGIVSTNYGSGNQQIVVSPSAGEGIIASQEYFMWVNEPKNEDFMKRWKDRYGLEEPIVSEAADVWNAVHLWAAAVQKAGSAKSAQVIKALESGLSFEGPNGLVEMQPGSHHLKQNIYIVKGNRKHSFDVVKTYNLVAPAYEDEVCDLIKAPRTAKHFTP